jgi:hypothetical protein
MKVFAPVYEDIEKLISEAKKSITIVSPWLKRSAVEMVLNNQKINDMKIRILTVGEVTDFLSGSSDFEIIQALYKIGAEIKLISNLHAKIYIADGIKAIITSANFTYQGLNRNVEVGAFIDDYEQVSQLEKIVDCWFNHGKQIDEKWLNAVSQNINKDQNSYNSYKERDKIYSYDPSLRGNVFKITSPISDTSNESECDIVDNNQPEINISMQYAESGNSVSQTSTIKNEGTRLNTLNDTLTAQVFQLAENPDAKKMTLPKQVVEELLEYYGISELSVYSDKLLSHDQKDADLVKRPAIQMAAKTEIKKSQNTVYFRLCDNGILTEGKFSLMDDSELLAKQGWFNNMSPRAIDRPDLENGGFDLTNKDGLLGIRCFLAGFIYRWVRTSHLCFEGDKKRKRIWTNSFCSNQ